MLLFQDWCVSQEEEVEGHALRVLSVDPDKLDDALKGVAAALPFHYASAERIVDMLERLGKPAAAEFLRGKLPEGDKIRSGDLGEIAATEYIGAETSYVAPIKRLRWKDHREMAMRGDDVIGVRQPDGDPIEFLKSEVKSRKALNQGVVTEARGALDHNGGLPSPHALSFVSDRLKEIGETDLADAIDDAQWKEGISPNQVEHLLFTFSQNDPVGFLCNDLEGYEGAIHQHNVGLSIADHQDFIANVYELAAHGDDN